MQMRLIMIQRQQFKTMTNGVIYYVFTLHVMIFQITDVFMQMDLELSMKVLMPQIVKLMAEHHVKKIYQAVQIQMQTTIMQMQM